MFPWACLQSEGANPSEEIMTTYQHSFRPITDHQPWVRSRSDVNPGLTGSCQDDHQTWPVFFQHLYKTTKCSGVGSQHSSGSPFPASLHSFGSSFHSEAAEGVSGTRREASAQEAGVAMGWRKSNDGFQYQEGVLLLYPYVNTISCDKFMTVLGKEAAPQLLLGPQVVSGPFTTPGQNRDAANSQNHLHSWSPADLQSNTCSFGGWTAERPSCFATQALHPHSGLSSTGPQVCGRHHPYTGVNRKQPLTEYQDKFSAPLPPSQLPVYFPPC